MVAAGGHGDVDRSDFHFLPRIIYIRFCSKSAVLLHRIKNQNIEAKMKSRSWKPLAIYREKPEAYTEGAVWKAPPFWKNGEKKCHRIASRCWNIASIKVRESGPYTPRDGTLVGYIFSKRYKKVSPHRKSHNLLYNLLREKNKPSPEMVNKRGNQLDRPGLKGLLTKKAPSCACRTSSWSAAALISCLSKNNKHLLEDKNE